MEKEYFIKLHDDSILEFKLISEDVFDEMVKQEGWVEYPEILKIQNTVCFKSAYTNGKEFVSLINDVKKDNAIFSKDKLFFQLLKDRVLVFFGERKYNPDDAHFMLMYYNEKTSAILRNHKIKKISGDLGKEEGYYEIDDGRYMYMFEDGRSEVFMNLRDMEILQDFIGRPMKFSV